MELEQFFRRDPIADRGISVVMPACNSAACLERAVAGIAEVLDRLGRGHEIIIVDDGSSDGSGEIADRLAAAQRRVRVIHHPARRGYGAALRSGIDLARYPLLLELAVEGGYAAAEVERLLGVIDGVDVVCGYRQPRPRRRPADWFYHRMVRFLFAVRLRDAECGFKLYRRAALRRIPIQSDGRFSSVEILAKANFMNLLVGEVPVRHDPLACGGGGRPREASRSTWREVWRVFRHPAFTKNRSADAADSSIQAA